MHRSGKLKLNKGVKFSATSRDRDEAVMAAPECHSPNMNQKPALSQSIEGRSPPGGNHVHFPEREANKIQKRRYLTAKYGMHQMALIRKRLAIEDWVYDELRRLYDCVNDSEDHNCQFDLEEVLNLEDDSQIREYVAATLADAKQPKEEIEKFTEEVLIKARTL
ncbi:protein phosphatase 1 regulatory subunit 14B-like [Liolophura sinensis]|uniref:protein phosphatase 1 regulatory subunit 14B-like n=1 Tax=Liolophura sinensis TaxID=3198878 RepID=UPI003158E217